MMWPNVEASSQTGAAISTDTRSGYLKSNQSKVFYHDGKWWAIAFNNPDSRWYIWKFSGSAWTKNAALNKSTTLKYDAVVNAAAGKLYVLGSHASNSEFWRFTYSSSGGSWAKDSGFHVNPSFLNADAANPVSLIQAKNGDFWIFRIENNKLQAKRSTDGGATWSSVIDIKTGLTTSSGITDAVAFTFAGNNYIGVAYGEADGAGSKYGFLIHRDGDANTAWTDESTALTFFGSERANNKIAATTDKNNNVFLFTQNGNVSSGEPSNTLYKRSSAGVWSKVAANFSGNWKTPAAAVDTSNNALYLMGVNATTLIGEYKYCAIGTEATLTGQTADVLLSASGAAFDDLSAPSKIGEVSGLLVCADNTTANDIWYNQIELEPVGGQPPVTVSSVTVSPNEANTNAAYTISFNLGAEGALAANTGAITISFPNNTSVIDAMPADHIKVNGVPATSATSNDATREVTMTTPIALANQAAVTVEFVAAAELYNPSNAGNYSLQVFTSAQTTPVNSPNYAITSATTSVSAATVAPSPNTTGAAAAYTIAFNLGANGRLLPGSSTITLALNNATSVANGGLAGVQVNGVNATAAGNSANKTVTITVPNTSGFGNGAAVSINLPSSTITNPTSEGDYTLTVATSVEATPIVSNTYSIADNSPPPATGEDDPISGTAGGYDKPHQNRPFYHAGAWWTAAPKSSDDKWYLWKLNGSSWSAHLEIDSRSSTRPDCYVDSPANKLYILLASTSGTGTKMLRLSYSSGAWSINSGFPVTLNSFTFSGESGNVFTKAMNGELWVFRYKSGKLEGQRSSNDGATWSSTFTVKSGLVSSGLADAVAFTSAGQNYVGVGYAENTSSSGKFGFLRHKDGDPDGSWTDETASIPQFANAKSDDHLSLAVGENNEIFFVCKTHPNSSSAASIGLLKRSAGGGWQNFTVQQDGGWTRPAVVVDETNNELYVLGTQESSSEHGQYKKCAIGNESALQNAAVVEIFDSAGFNNLSVPQHRITGAIDLLVCAEKTSGNEIWYNLLPIAGGAAKLAEATERETKLSKATAPSNVSAYPNPFNPATTIRFTLAESAPVKLQLFNLRGELVRTLAEGEFQAGVHEQRWNGRDHFGRPVASGMYFYRLRIGAAVWNGRLQMVK